jgi:WD40 repeat protein
LLSIIVYYLLFSIIFLLFVVVLIICLLFIAIFVVALFVLLCCLFDVLIIVVFLSHCFNTKGCVNAISFNKEGNLLVSGSDDREVCIWDWASGTCLTALRFDFAVFLSLFSLLSAH